MHRLLLTLALALSLLPTRARALDCGNGPLICTPMYGLFEEKSPERRLLEQLFQKLVASASNDRERFLRDPLSTAVSEIRNGANDASVKFWVMVQNPTSRPLTAKFYVSAAKKPTKVYSSLWLNCPRASAEEEKEMCPDRRNPFPGDTDRGRFDKVMAELLADGEIIAEAKLDVPAGAVKVIGIKVPDTDGGDTVAIALLGGQAPSRLRLDGRDVLRLGFADRKTD